MKLTWTFALTLLLGSTTEAAEPIDADNWRTHAQREIARTGVQQNSNIAERVYSLRGIDPAVYLAARRKVPTVSAELRALRLPAGVLFELYLKAGDRYPFAARSAYPSMGDAAWRRVRHAERSALRQGLLDAIAASGHPVAPYLLADVAEDVGADPTERRVAAVSLGATEGPGADRRLVRIATEDRTDVALRAAAIAGLGKHRGPVALPALIRLSRTAPSSLRSTAIAAIGSYATHQARNRIGPDEADRAAVVLVELLLADDGTNEQILVEAIARTGSAAALAALEKHDGRSARRAAKRLRRTRSRF